MEKSLDKIFGSDREDIFEKYSNIIYAIAAKISPDASLAEQLLVGSFQKIFRETPVPGALRPFSLIRFVLRTAEEHLGSRKLTKHVQQRPCFSRESHNITRLFSTVSKFGR